MRLSCYWSWISSSHCQSSLRIHSAIASWIHSYFDNVNFTVACSVTRPLNGSEAPGDLLLRQTSQLLLCKSSCSYAKLVGSNYVTSTLTMWNLFFRNNVEITLRLFFLKLKTVGTKRTRTRITGLPSGNHIHLTTDVTIPKSWIVWLEILTLI